MSNHSNYETDIEKAYRNYRQNRAYAVKVERDYAYGEATSEDVDFANECAYNAEHWWSITYWESEIEERYEYPQPMRPEVYE